MGDDRGRGSDTDDVDLQLCPRHGERGVDVRQRKAAREGVAIPAGGNEADPLLSKPHRVERAGICPLGGHFQGDEPLRRSGVTLAQRGIPPDEIELVEGDEAIQSAHTRGVRPGVLA